jgi:cytochrome c oxidase cbb3-type subunit III
MPHSIRHEPLTLLALCAFVGVLLGQAAPQNAGHKKASTSAGKQAFASTCGGCHGLDGKGGERAPSIADRPSVQQLTDLQISHIIQNGKPGTGMPAFHTLTGPQVKSIVAYLRTLQGARQTVHLPGEPARGQTLFFGKAGCSSCHMVAGQGGFIGADLSECARTQDIEEIRSAIVNPASSKSAQVRLVTATLHNGDRFVGRIRNEDNFSLQLQEIDGTFHFFLKSDIKGIESNAQPLMPSDYGSTLAPEELNDIISYLMSVATTGSNAMKKDKDDDWEDQ